MQGKFQSSRGNQNEFVIGNVHINIDQECNITSSFAILM